MVAGAFAPSTTASWGNISGDISLQTDIIEYLEEYSGSITSGNTTSGTYVSGSTIYATDGTWSSKSFTSNNYHSLGFTYSGTRNYYSTSNFNTAYIYPSSYNSSYPTTITIACYISSTSYDYNLKPVNKNGSTTATNHMLSSSWNNIELKVGGWLVYTVKLMYSSSYSYKYLWTREVYSD